MKRLIVSADDFGLTHSVNEGIVKAYREGVVTNLNCLPTGEAFEELPRLIEDLNLHDIGAHLSLTETHYIGNVLHKNYKAFFLKSIFGVIKEDIIYAELKRQLEKIRRLGVNITNLNSHEHLHMIPSVLKVFICLAKEYDIPSIRYPCCEKNRKFSLGRLYKNMVQLYFKGGMERMLKENNIAYPKHFAGFFDSGRLTEDVLSDILTHLEDGVTELVCHPGFLGPEILDRYRWHMNCEYELYALTSRRTKALLTNQDIQLIGYREFLSKERE